MTHSHDTSTPAMSAETVPSEEFVLVPRELTERMALAGESAASFGIGRPNDDEAIRRVWREMIAAAPTLSASHLAKEGGEAGAVDWLWFGRDEADKEHVSFGRWQKHPCQHRYKLAAIQPTEHDHPQPSPALAKGGDAVREALKTIETAIDLGLKAHDSDSGDDDLTPFRRAFGALEVVRAALSTPTEGPASQTEGMGGDAVAVPYDDFYAAYQFVPRSKMSPDHCLKTRLRSLLREEDLAHVDEAEAIAAITPPETAEAAPDDPNLWHFWNEKARWLAVKLDKAERKLADAVKALETTREEAFDEALKFIASRAHAALAARSASSQGGE